MTLHDPPPSLFAFLAGNGLVSLRETCARFDEVHPDAVAEGLDALVRAGRAHRYHEPHMPADMAVYEVCQHGRCAGAFA